MARLLKETDIKPALKLATSSTKKLVIAGVNGDEDFPKLLANCTWTGTRDYNMALIIIAFYVYCMKSKDDDLKKFGRSVLRESSSSSKLFEHLREGNGKKVKYNMGSYFQAALDAVLKKALPDDEGKRAKIIKSFINQAGKITSWVINQNDVDKLINQLTGRVKYKGKPSDALHDIFWRYDKKLRLDEIQELLNYGANPNVQYGMPLRVAVRYGNIQIVDLLLQYGADPNLTEKGGYGYTALHDAVYYKPDHIEMIRLLLQHGANPNLQCNKGTPLHLAVFWGGIKTVELLLQHGANPNVQHYQYRYTPLHKAIYDGRIKGEGGQIKIVELLLQHGADPNLQDNLHAAIENNFIEIVRLLLNRGANPNLQNSVGDTPLHNAVVKANKEIVELLLNHRADPNSQDDYDYTPLNLAAKIAYDDHTAHDDYIEEIIELLLQHGAKPDIQGVKGVSPLHQAALNRNNNIVALLLKHHANPNVQDRSGETPLHIAARKRDLGIVELLLANGADPDIKNKKGETPKEIMERNTKK